MHFQRKVKKRAWVLKECIDRVPDDIEAVEELLNYGLQLTDVDVLVAVGKGVCFFLHYLLIRPILDNFYCFTTRRYCTVNLERINFCRSEFLI